MTTLPANLELERKVIAACLRSASDCETAHNVLRDGHFTSPVYRSIFAVLSERFALGQSLDGTSVKGVLLKRNKMKPPQADQVFAELRFEPLEDINVESACGLLNDLFIARRLRDLSDTIADQAVHGEPSGQIISYAEETLRNLGEFQQSEDQLWTLGKLLDSTPQKHAKIYDATGGNTGIFTPWTGLNELIGGMRGGRMYVLAARPSYGKAQPLHSKVLTPSGWKTMGDIQIGDVVTKAEGGDCRVIATHDNGTKPIYRITFWDGRAVECCGDHLWNVYYRDWESHKTISANKISEMLTRKRYRRRIWIDNFSGDFGVNKDLPMDPWMLGALIGDGYLHRGCVRITKKDQYVIDRVRNTLPLGYKMTPNGKYGYAIGKIIHNSRKPNIVAEAIKALGLMDTHSYNKFIPREYLSASKEQRLELLRGLMDTDGCIDAKSTPSYTTTSKQLADDFVYLCKSLGLIVSSNQRTTYYTHKGEKREGRVSYRMQILGKDPREIFSSPQRLNKIGIGARRTRLCIKSVEPVGELPAKCITIDSLSGLYVTDDFIVTHNSGLVAQLAYSSAKKGFNVVMFSHEMARDAIWRRIASAETSVRAWDMEMGELKSDEQKRVTDWLETHRDASLYVSDCSGRTIQGMNAEIRRFAAKIGPPHLVIIDYLQLMKSGYKTKSEYEDVSELSGACRRGCRDFNCAFVVLSQLNRAIEDRESGEPHLSDLRATGALEQDADAVIFIHRPGLMSIKRGKGKDQKEYPKAYTELLVKKMRQGRTGCVKLEFQGAYSRFREIQSEDEIVEVR